MGDITAAAAAAADDATIGDLEAELKMKREVRWRQIHRPQAKNAQKSGSPAAPYGNASPHNARGWASSANPTAHPA